MPTERVVSPWRRCLRFSVRGLIVLVLLIGAGLGWLVRSARIARIQREAVAAIERAGGFVEYDSNWRARNPSFQRMPWALQWLVDRFEDEYLRHVVSVHVSSLGAPARGDPLLTQIGRLTRVEELDLCTSSAADADFSHLENLHNLVKLRIHGDRISDAGLLHLSGLTNLRELDLSSLRIADAGLAHLKGLTNLSILRLNSTKVSDAGLEHLKALTKLSTLELNSAQITDVGLVNLKALKNLENLNISHTHITETGAQELQRALPRVWVEYQN